MKKYLLGGVASVVLSAGAAMAADMPVRAPIMKAPPLVAAAYNWSGFYTASSVGGQWWDINGAYVATLDRHNTSGSAGISGSHVGYQYQFGGWVIGVEGGYNAAWRGRGDLSTSLSPSADCLGATAVLNRTCESRIKNYWTAGGKAGWAWNNFMVYGAGGYANGRIFTDTIVTGTNPPVLTSVTDQRHGGWYAGIGADMFVTKLWLTDLILGVEYQHVDLTSRLHVDTLVGATGANNRNMRATDEVVRFKVTSKW